MRSTPARWLPTRIGTAINEVVQNAAHGRICLHQGIAEQTQRVEAALQQMEEGGAVITRLSDEDRAKWAAALPQIAEAWAKNAEEQGLPGSEVLDAYMGLLKDAGVSVGRDWTQR